MKAAPVVLSLCATAMAQNVLHTFGGDSRLDRLGRSVSGAGDVNGDGVDDLIVGASGYARVFSGLDGSILYTFRGNSVFDVFGGSVSGAGDANGDGFADLIIGAHFEGDGTARVFSGRDGSNLYTFRGDTAGEELGFSVSGAGDVNGDGFDDVIVGAWRDNDNAVNSGSAKVFSGRDGSTVHTFNGDSAGDFFGFSVSDAGDVNGDGFADLVVGAKSDDNNGTSSGSARVFSGCDGSILYTFNGDSAGDVFGGSVGGAGDVNGDGFADVIVGAESDGNNGRSSGSARVFSGRDGSILYTFNGDSPEDLFGRSVGGAGDVNADGFADLIVGAVFDDNNGWNSGSARVFSGRDGTVLHTFNGTAHDHLGQSVSAAGDVNCDGFADMIVGAPDDDSPRVDSGSAFVFSGFTASNANPPLFKVFGHSCAGSNGWLPHVGSRGRPAIGETFTLLLRAARASTAAVIDIDPSRHSIDLAPFGAPGCRLWTLALASARRVTDRSGRATLALAVPNSAALFGVTLYTQWLVADTRANALGWVTTDAAIFRIGRP